MGLNWTEIAEQARLETNEDLAPHISSLTTMRDSEIAELFATPADKEQLATLMAIVKSADDHNTKVSRIVNNIESLADVVIKVAETLA